MIFLRLLALLLVSIACRVPSAAAQDVGPAGTTDGESALFLGGGFTVPITEKVSVNTLGAVALGEIDSDFASINMAVKPTPRVTLAAGYFGFFEGPTPSRPDPFDHRVRLDATFRWPVGQFVVQHRQRFEYRFRDVPDGWRWRPEIRLERPVRAGGRTIRPYIGLEPFYEFNTTTLTAYLVEGGAVIPLSKRWSINPGYLGVIGLNDVADLHFYTAFFQYRFGR